MNKTEIGALAERAQAGDKSAFEALYGEFYEKVYFFAKRNTGSDDAAQDIAAGTFAAAFENISQLRKGESFIGWLYAIAYSQCVRYARDSSAGRHFEDGEQLEKALADASLSEPVQLPEDYAVNSDTKEKLRSVIDGLPADQRSAVILYYYQDMTVAEVARSLGTNENNAKQKLYKARKNIRKGIEKLFGSAALLSAVPMDSLISNTVDDSFAKAAVSGAARVKGGSLAVKLTAFAAAAAVAVGVPLALGRLGSKGGYRPEDTSLEKGYVNIDSIREEQRELTGGDTGFSDSGSFTVEEKGYRLNGEITQYGKSIYVIGGPGSGSFVLDTETGSVFHFCNIAGCAHSENSPGCLDHVRWLNPTATSRGIYYTVENDLMLFDGKESRMICENDFCTDYERQVAPDCPEAITVMFQSGRCFLMGAAYFRTFDIDTGRAGEPVIVSEESNVLSWCADDEYVFFSTENQELFSCRLSDNRITKLDDKTSQVRMYDGRLYYTRWEGDTPMLMRAGSAGKDPELLISGCYLPYALTDKAVYYTHFRSDAGTVYVYDLATGQTAEADLSAVLREDDPLTPDVDEQVTYPQESFYPFITYDRQGGRVYVIDGIRADGAPAAPGPVIYAFEDGSADPVLLGKGV